MGTSRFPEGMVYNPYRLKVATLRFAWYFLR